MKFLHKIKAQFSKDGMAKREVPATIPKVREEKRQGSDKRLQEEEYEVVEREIHPANIICPDCGGITLEGLDYCNKCGGELNYIDGE